MRVMGSLVGVAKEAVEFGTNPAGSAIRSCHPLAELPGRIVTHVLAMAALQLGHPVTLFVKMEAGDWP